MSQQQQQQQHQPDELHYAELSSISLSRNYKANATGSGTSNNNAATGGPGGNFDIYSDKLGQNKTLPKKAPAYDYFNEPTVYAQIDHFKTMPSATATIPQSSISATPNCSNASSITKKSPSNVTVSAYQIPHSSHQSYQSHLMTDPGNGNGIGISQNATGNSSVATLSNSNTLTFSSIQSPSSSTASYQNQPNQQQPLTSTSSKPFSREIVTIRTPLLYTQQESCV